MRRRDFLAGVGGGAAGALLPLRLPAWAGMPPQPADRGVVVYVASGADAGIHEAAMSIVQASGHPLLQAMGPKPVLAKSRATMLSAADGTHDAGGQKYLESLA